MATVVLPRSLVALFPGLARRQDVAGGTVGSVIDVLDGASPGLRDRLVESGPRLRPHINVYVAGRPADLTTPVADGDTVHVIPAVSGGAGSVTPGRQPPSRSPSAKLAISAPTDRKVRSPCRRRPAATPGKRSQPALRSVAADLANWVAERGNGARGSL